MTTIAVRAALVPLALIAAACASLRAADPLRAPSGGRCVAWSPARAGSRELGAAGALVVVLRGPHDAPVAARRLRLLGDTTYVHEVRAYEPSARRPEPLVRFEPVRPGAYQLEVLEIGYYPERVPLVVRSGRRDTVRIAQQVQPGCLEGGEGGCSERPPCERQPQPT